MENLEGYLETHFDVVGFIIAERQTDYDTNSKVDLTIREKGLGGLYELAKEWTDEFTEKYKDEVWGEKFEYYDTLEVFLNNKNQ